MGKRSTIILVFVAISTVLITGLTTYKISASSGLGSIYGSKTNAQEINFDRSSLIMSKASIVNDAVTEQSIVADYDNSKQIKVLATAYTSDPDETDSTPNITASGTRTRDGVAAANFLPFGTKFMIPEVYGNKVFTVEDRLNAKYNNQKRIDIWMQAKTEALNFGKKSITLQLL